MFRAILIYVPGYLSLQFIFGGSVCGFNFFQIDVLVVLSSKSYAYIVYLFKFLVFFFFLFKLIPTKVVSFCRVVG
jgi:hypothetical protein